MAGPAPQSHRYRTGNLPSRIVKPLLDLLFPPHCVACGGLGSWFCDDCISKIQMQLPPLCVACGKPLATGGTCRRCQRDPLPLDGLRSVARYEAPLREAIHALKYEGVRVLAAPLGELMADYLTQLGLPAEVLVPVPLHRSRERQRGYNQSRLLAHAVAQRLGIPVVEALVRERNTPAQVHLSRHERFANVQGAFRATDADLHSKRVLLIDDVCTTGATLAACAQALTPSRVRSIWALTLARAYDTP
ncbi:MAG: ComF family protein [Anaerolineae bacterium]